MNSLVKAAHLQERQQQRGIREAATEAVYHYADVEENLKEGVIGYAVSEEALHAMTSDGVPTHVREQASSLFLLIGRNGAAVTVYRRRRRATSSGRLEHTQRDTEIFLRNKSG